MDNKKQIERLLQLPCPSCGGHIKYSAAQQQITCDYCGYTEEADNVNDLVEELSLKEAIKAAKRYTPEDFGERVVGCQNCGARYMMQKTDVHLQCPFCASKKVNLEAYDHNLIQPSGILPFKIPEQAAIEKFERWIGNGWFYPSKLKRLATLERMRGVYIPFWTYDAQTDTKWQGEAGFYQDDAREVFERGQFKNQEQREVRWEYRQGQFSYFFDDVLIVASKGLHQRHFSRILLYQLEEVINFDARLILGWEAEIYNLEVDDGYDRAERIMDERLRGMAIAKMGGDTYRNLRLQTQKYDQTFKHLILPVWICAYRYNDKVYQFVVNGQTGRVGGQKPLSYYKIAFMILLFIGALAALYWYRISR